LPNNLTTIVLIYHLRTLKPEQQNYSNIITQTLVLVSVFD